MVGHVQKVDSVGTRKWKCQVGDLEVDYREDMKVAGVWEKDELQRTSVLFSTDKSEVKHFQVQLQLISADSHMTKTLSNRHIHPRP